MLLKNLAKSVFALTMLFAATGCEDDDPVLIKDPVLNIVPETVEVASEGGDASVRYTIEDAVEGASVQVSCAEEWISDFNCETEGEIAFKVAANESEEPREGIVEVNYEGLTKAKTFTVKQAGYVAPAPFEIEVKKVTNVAATVSVTPLDKEMRFVVSRKGAKAVEQLGDDDALFQSDMDAFKKMAENEEMPVEQVLDILSWAGDQEELELSVLKPGDEFICYVYGIDIKTMERLTDIVKVNFKTIPVEFQDIKFDIKADVNVATVTASINTVGSDGYYYCSFYELSSQENIENRLMNLLTDEWMSNFAFYYDLDWLPEDMLKDGAYRGEMKETMELEAGTTYVIAAVALNSDALICSEKVAYKVFTTDTPKPSENTFTIDISKIGATKAYLKITPSNNDPYAAGILPYSMLEGLESEEAVIDFLINQFMPNTFHGPFESDVRPLDPETEYFVFAFGYEAYIPTTALTYKTFMTEKKSDATSSVEGFLNYGEYADAVEVGKLDPFYAEVAQEGTALIPFSTNSKPEGLQVYWNIFRPEDLADPSITDDLIIQSLTLSGFTSASEIYQLPYGLTFIGVAVAEDEQGNPGKLYRGEPLTLTPEGVMPAADYLAKYPFPEAAKSAKTYRTTSSLKTTTCNSLMSKALLQKK